MLLRGSSYQRGARNDRSEINLTHVIAPQREKERDRPGFACLYRVVVAKERVTPKPLKDTARKQMNYQKWDIIKCWKPTT